MEGWNFNVSQGSWKKFVIVSWAGGDGAVEKLEKARDCKPRRAVIAVRGRCDGRGRPAVKFYKTLTKTANFPAGKVIKCNRQKVIAAFAGLQISS